eukprot:gb/GFBE01031979.1/.p1 GENE.gb/GFBE01031979.1/~~gb/GFBE01031979.1/.p1  ORF type:complete len:510 (+),score=62.79 gb/GFBE01031979.1/:1-1530(+)
MLPLPQVREPTGPSPSRKAASGLGGLWERRRKQEASPRLVCKPDRSAPSHGDASRARRPSVQGLQERYTVLERIGQGAASMVYRAVRKADGKQVAMKVMRALDEEMAESRRQEYTILCKLKHPHIISALDFFNTSDQSVLVLQHFDGVTLTSAVKSAASQHFTEATSKEMFRMLLEAIDYLHQRRIVHRDIKGDNVLVSHDVSNLCLLDFNAARSLMEGGSLTMTGTKEYAAPEVLTGDSPSDCADIWSAGLCLHLMIAGCLPRKADHFQTLEAFVKAVSTQPAALQGEVWSNISVACKELLRKCLIIDSRFRPAAMTLLRDSWFQQNSQEPSSEEKLSARYSIVSHETDVTSPGRQSGWPVHRQHSGRSVETDNSSAGKSTSSQGVAAARTEASAAIMAMTSEGDKRSFLPSLKPKCFGWWRKSQTVDGFGDDTAVTASHTTDVPSPASPARPVDSSLSPRSPRSPLRATSLIPTPPPRDQQKQCPVKRRASGIELQGKRPLGKQSGK